MTIAAQRLQIVSVFEMLRQSEYLQSRQWRTLIILSFIVLFCLALSCAEKLHDNNEDPGIPLKIIGFFSGARNTAESYDGITRYRREVQFNDMRHFPAPRSDVKTYRFGGR